MNLEDFGEADWRSESETGKGGDEDAIEAGTTGTGGASAGASADADATVESRRVLLFLVRVLVLLALVLAFMPLPPSIGDEEIVMALASLPSFDRDEAAGGDEV